MLTLQPVYENLFLTAELEHFHALNGDMSDAQLRAFLEELHRYAHSSGPSPDRLETLAADLIGREVQVVAGGLVARRGEFLLIPGCCCGLEGWVEWEVALSSGRSPWLGHDPDPWIETKDNRITLHNGGIVEPESCELDVSEVEAALKRARDDLTDFLIALKTWLLREGIVVAEDLTSKVDGWFQMTGRVPRPVGQSVSIQVRDSDLGST